jgi:hypothetical protein
MKRKLEEENKENNKRKLIEENKTIKIFISYDNKLNELDIEEEKSIEELKKVIEEKIKIKKEYQILKKLDDNFVYEETLKENNIKNEETLILINTEEKEENEEIKLCGKFLKIIKRFMFCIKSKRKSNLFL